MHLYTFASHIVVALPQVIFVATAFITNYLWMLFLCKCPHHIIGNRQLAHEQCIQRDTMLYTTTYNVHDVSCIYIPPPHVVALAHVIFVAMHSIHMCVDTTHALICDWHVVHRYTHHMDILPTICSVNGVFRKFIQWPSFYCKFLIGPFFMLHTDILTLS